MFKNNKGFSLIEVLVTVGLIGVLVSIAVPAYNKYKKGTNRMAMKADLGNASKTYTAYDAVNDTFCASFTQVGFNINPTSPVWQRNAFIGFGGVDTADCAQDDANIKYESKEVSDDQEGCESIGGTWGDNDGVATTPDDCNKASTAYAFGGTVPSACKLGASAFKMGASAEAADTTDSAGITNLIQVTDGGAIQETNSADCN